MSFRIGGFLAVLCSAVVFAGCVDNSDPADSGVPPAWPHGGAAFDEKYGNGDGLNFDPASYQERPDWAGEAQTNLLPADSRIGQDTQVIFLPARPRLPVTIL